VTGCSEYTDVLMSVLLLSVFAVTKYLDQSRTTGISSLSSKQRSICDKVSYLLSRDGATVDGVSDWMIGFIAPLYIHSSGLQVVQRHC
jgi:hypothetical protein